MCVSYWVSLAGFWLSLCGSWIFLDAFRLSFVDILEDFWLTTPDVFGDFCVFLDDVWVDMVDICVSLVDFRVFLGVFSSS